jgi:ribosomal protein L29
MNNSVSPLENPLQLRYKKRNIARLKTELTKRNKAAK